MADINDAARALLAEFSYTEREGHVYMTPGSPGRVSDAALALRAALAVAPATAQPGAPTWWARSHDDLPRPTLYATEDAARDAASLDGGKVFPLYAAPPATGDAAAVRPDVVCLCGSTRFIDTFAEQYGRLTDEGKIVLTVGRVVPQSEQALGSPRKAALDVLHLRKIDLADRVLVLNVGGYVGPSTRREIAYAKERGKPIDLLYPDAGLDGAAPALPLPAPASVQPISDEMRDRLACVTASKSKENPVNDIPRRIRIDLQTPIEAAIRAARDAVETGPAHPHMTRATVLLGQALDAVADFVDGVPERADAPSTAVEEARDACVNVCRNVAMSFSARRTEDSEASHTAFIHALNAGQRLLAAEAAAKSNNTGDVK